MSNLIKLMDMRWLPAWLQLTPPVEEFEHVIAPHVHEWEHKGSTYAPPSRQAVPSTVDPIVLKELLLGLTIHLFECVLCHETKQEEMLGSTNPQLDDTLDKTVMYGPQYLQRDGITFVVQRYVPPTQQIGALPLR